MGSCKLFPDVSTWPENRKISMAVLGCSLLTFPFLLNTYFGNFLPYLASYYQAVRAEVNWYIDPLWVISIFNTFVPLSMVACGYMEQRFGLRQTIFLGGVMAAVSILTSYVAIREPAALVFTYGFVNALGTGLLYSLCTKIIFQVATTKKGLAFGVMTAFQSVGSLINIGLAFAVINPRNTEPDLVVENTNYFSDAGLVSRVPYYFIAVGLLTVVSSLVGYGMIELVAKDLNLWTKKKPGDPVNEKTKLTNDKDLELQGLDKETLCLDPTESASVNDRSPILQNINKPLYSASAIDTTKETFVEYASTNGHETIPMIQDVSTTLNEPEVGKAPRDTQQEVDMTPGEALKSFNFWLIWFASLFLAHTFYVLTNLYKQYGLLRISDDQILVITGILATVTLIVTRPLAGVLADWFGVKMIMVQTCSVSSVFMALMIVTIHFSPPLYIVTTIVEFTCSSTYFLISSLLVNELLGSTHYPSIIGLVYTARVVSSLLDPVIVKVMVAAVGWDWVFVSGVISGILSVFFSLALPEPKIKE